MLRIKKIIIGLMLSICIVFQGCTYVAYKDYYTKVDDYEKIWSLTGFRHGYDGVSVFFPQSIEQLNVKTFFCRYDQQIPLGEGVQIILEIHYHNTSDFDIEVSRLASLGYECNNYFSETTYKAYATRIDGKPKGSCYSSEYALTDAENQLVYYIYLQDVPKNEIEIPIHLLPNTLD